MTYSNIAEMMRQGYNSDSRQLMLQNELDDCSATPPSRFEPSGSIKIYTRILENDQSGRHSIVSPISDEQSAIMPTTEQER